MTVVAVFCSADGAFSSLTPCVNECPACFVYYVAHTPMTDLPSEFRLSHIPKGWSTCEQDIDRSIPSPIPSS